MPDLTQNFCHQNSETLEEINKFYMYLHYIEKLCLHYTKSKIRRAPEAIHV